MRVGDWRLRLLPARLLGPALLAWPILGSLVTCPFPLPWVMCDVCEVPGCPFRTLRGYLLSGVALSAAVTGRAFCSWACPLGMLQELLGLPLARPRRVGVLVQAARLTMLLLAGTLTAYMLWPSILPVSMTPLLDVAYEARIPLLIVVLAASIAYPRPWCELCPLGGLLGAANKVCLVRFRVDEASCTKCSRCSSVCPVGLRPGELHVSSRCVKCFTCNLACPRGCVRPRPLAKR